MNPLTTAHLGRYPFALTLILTLLLGACGPEAAQSPTTLAPQPTAAPVEDAPAPAATAAATAAPGPTAEPDATPENALCQQVLRPALVLLDRGDYFITDPTSGETCPFAFPGEFPGLIQSGGGALYYHELDVAGQTTTITRLDPDGAATPLTFTQTRLPASFLHYVISPDGARLAWSSSRTGASGAAVSDLWLANTDGSGLVQLLNGVPATDNRLVVPIRFSRAGDRLYYDLQPNGVGGSWVAFSGRYDSLFSVSLDGTGQPVELFRCPAGNLLCLGDFYEGEQALLLAYTDPATGTVRVLDPAGQAPSAIIGPFPGADYIAYPTFAPGGDLAFYVATVGEHPGGYPVPRPGTLYQVRPPYTAQPEAVHSGDQVAMLIGWLGKDGLVYNSVDTGGNWGTAVVALSGETWTWGPGPAQFIAVLP